MIPATLIRFAYTLQGDAVNQSSGLLLCLRPTEYKRAMEGWDHTIFKVGLCRQLVQESPVPHYCSTLALLAGSQPMSHELQSCR